MRREVKYIVFSPKGDGYVTGYPMPVIFPDLFDHAAMARKFENDLIEATSAGFVSLYPATKKNGGFVGVGVAAEVYGDSISLALKPNEGDGALITKFYCDGESG